MSEAGRRIRGIVRRGNIAPSSYVLAAISVIVQSILGLFLGHAYDMRIYMATGYLVSSGQNPYIPQNLTAIFQNSSFQGMTSVGYPPPWPLVTGLVYISSYRIFPNLLFYNLALKIPIIAANIFLAVLVMRVLSRLGAGEKAVRWAWVTMLFNPLLLYVSVAWGQFDTLVALLALASILLLNEKRLILSAFLLALAISFKPTALPLLAAFFIFLRNRPFKELVRYFSFCLLCIVFICVIPFLIFHWSAEPILGHWNAQFTVGGGLSYMTFLELLSDSYLLPGWWWLVGLLWVPALVTAALAIRPGDGSLMDLIKKSSATIMIFFLFRSWLSEPNLALLLPLLVILVATGGMDRRLLIAFWTIPLVFSFFNTSTFQLLFPGFPDLMTRLLHFSEMFRTARLILRVIVVIPWILTAIGIIFACLKPAPIHSKQSQLAETNFS